MARIGDTGISMVRHYLRAANKAIASFDRDDGWAIASHITLSGVIALFPFLIFCASLAAFLDLGEFPDTVVHLIFDIWPVAVAGPLSAEIRAVLTEPRGDVLTLGALVSLYFATNGVEALRLGLNRAYKVAEDRGVVRLRLQSVAFVIVAALVASTTTFLIVLAPLAGALARRIAPAVADWIAAIAYWRLAVSFLVLVAALFACHFWLPTGRRSLGRVLPGILFTLVCWLGAAQAFALYLKGFADYVGTYAGLAGIMVALVFVYTMAAIFLIGAEFNTALKNSRNGTPPARRLANPVNHRETRQG